MPEFVGYVGFVRAELAKLEKCLSVESDDYLLWIVL